MTTDDRQPYCFGDLATVFPMGPDGLRTTPESCLYCCCKTECLRTAMAGAQGVLVREETVDRAYRAGLMGFFERWSRKKALSQGKKKSGGGR